MPTLTTLHTMQEAAKHNTRQDCWVVVDGKIYDVSSYLDDHPGGDDVLLSAAGRDSTEEFEDAGHSKSARELMENYYIGDIDPTAVVPEPEIMEKNEPSDFITMLTSKKVQQWAIPVTILGISVTACILFLRKK